MLPHGHLHSGPMIDPQYIDRLEFAALRRLPSNLFAGFGGYPFNHVVLAGFTTL
jgi:hypothetical protein